MGHDHAEADDLLSESELVGALLPPGTVEPLLAGLRAKGAVHGPLVLRAVSATLHARGAEGGAQAGRALLEWTRQVVVTAAAIAIDEDADEGDRANARWALEEAALSTEALGFGDAAAVALSEDEAFARCDAAARALWPDLVIVQEDEAGLDPDDTSVVSLPPPPW